MTSLQLIVLVVSIYIGWRAARWVRDRDRGPCRHQLELVWYNPRGGTRCYVCTLCGHEVQD